MLYKGWVSARLCDYKLLKSFGISVGPFNSDENVFDDCIVPEEAFTQLNEHFDAFKWGLDVFEAEKCK